MRRDKKVRSPRAWASHATLRARQSLSERPGGSCGGNRIVTEASGGCPRMNCLPYSPSFTALLRERGPACPLQLVRCVACCACAPRCRSGSLEPSSGAHNTDVSLSACPSTDYYVRAKADIINGWITPPNPLCASPCSLAVVPRCQRLRRTANATSSIDLKQASDTPKERTAASPSPRIRASPRRRRQPSAASPPPLLSRAPRWL